MEEEVEEDKEEKGTQSKRAWKYNKRQCPEDSQNKTQLWNKIWEADPHQCGIKLISEYDDDNDEYYDNDDEKKANGLGWN